MAWLDAGHMAEGSPADLVIFEPENFRDKATFAEPLLPPEGIRYVIVNGNVAVDEGLLNASPCGRFLTRD